MSQDQPPQKPPTLPEQPEQSPDDTEPSAKLPERPSVDTEPAANLEDTQPTRPVEAVQPKPIIPPPPGAVSPVPTRVIRKRRGKRTQGLLGAAAIAALISLIIALVFAVLIVIYAPPEYVDPWIPGRLATRTAEAQIARSTDQFIATREAAFQGTQAQVATDVSATETAVFLFNSQQSTQNALNAIGTDIALRQTATGAAVSFDATRTSVALQAQNAAAQSTLEAIRFNFTQTAVVQEAQSTAAAATISFNRLRPTQPTVEAVAVPLPTLANTDFSTFFFDDFEDGIDPAWNAPASWRTTNGQAMANVCGSTLLIGNAGWSNFSAEVDVDSPGAQVAVTLGYGSSGRLYVNFGLNGALWWLTEGADLIDTEIQSNAYDPTNVYRVRVEARERVVAVYVNQQLLAERLLPQSAGGPVGLYTCPANAVVPAFDNVRVSRLR
jgi:hypothetical protein